jgi:hypothetical protein
MGSQMSPGEGTSSLLSPCVISASPTESKSMWALSASSRNSDTRSEEAKVRAVISTRLAANWLCSGIQTPKVQ